MPPQTWANVHTHPTRLDPYPSGIEGGKRNDVGLAEQKSIIVYTIHRDGIFKYDPSTNTKTQEEKSSWQENVDPDLVQVFEKYGETYSDTYQNYIGAFNTYNSSSKTVNKLSNKTNLSKRQQKKLTKAIKKKNSASTQLILSAKKLSELEAKINQELKSVIGGKGS